MLVFPSPPLSASPQPFGRAAAVYLTSVSIFFRGIMVPKINQRHTWFWFQYSSKLQFCYRSWPNSAVRQPNPLLKCHRNHGDWGLWPKSPWLLLTQRSSWWLTMYAVAYIWGVFSIYKCMLSDILLLHRTTGIYSNTNNTLHLIYRADIAVSIVLPACTNLLLKNFVPP